MVNNIIESVKQEYSVPVYNLQSLATISNNEIYLTVFDSQFLEILLLKIRGESIKYSSIKKKKQCNREAQIMADIETLQNSGSIHNLNLLEDKKMNFKN